MLSRIYPVNICFVSAACYVLVPKDTRVCKSNSRPSRNTPASRRDGRVKWVIRHSVVSIIVSGISTSLRELEGDVLGLAWG